MSTYDVFIKLSNGVKDRFVVTAKSKKEAVKKGKHYVDTIIGDCRDKCRLTDIEAKEH